MSKRSKRIKRRAHHAAAIKPARAAGVQAFVRARLMGLSIQAARQDQHRVFAAALKLRIMQRGGRKDCGQ